MSRKKVPHQEHFGRRFYQDKKTGYWISCDYPRIRAHRWVWINCNGPIPKSCHVHHIDEDRSNNDISNLQLVSFRQHAMIHMTSDRLDSLRELAKEGRKYCPAWHRSEEGRAWHKLHALKYGFGKWEKIDKICENCSRVYFSPTQLASRFCSNKCKSAWRRKSRIDDEIRKCEKCTSEFSVNKYSKQRFCSKTCAKSQR
jgi:hypothetical protein